MSDYDYPEFRARVADRGHPRRAPGMTEPCATCRRPVEVGRWAVRSRFSGGVLCHDHAAVPRSTQPETGEAMERIRLETRAAGTGDTSARAYVDRVLAIRAAQTPEERFEREWLDARISGRVSESEFRAAMSGVDVDDEDDEDRGSFEVDEFDYEFQAAAEYRDDGDYGYTIDDCEIRRYDPDGTAVYGEERDGGPVEGRWYESRWWVPGGHEDRDAGGLIERTFEFTLVGAS